MHRCLPIMLDPANETCSETYLQGTVIWWGPGRDAAVVPIPWNNIPLEIKFASTMLAFHKTLQT